MIFNKNTLNKNSLLKELKVLSYSDRVNKIALLGRDNNCTNYNELLSSLIIGTPYEANLSLIGASVTKNIDIILQGLKHPSSNIRKKSIGLLGKLAPERYIQNEIENLSYECRKKLLLTISLYNRNDIAEKLLPMVFSKWGAKEASILLPTCSEKTVSIWIDKLGYAINNWNILSAKHTNVVFNYFKRTLETTPSTSRRNTWYNFFGAMANLSLFKGNELLDCILNLGPENIIFSVLKNSTGILATKNHNKVHTLLTSIENRKDLLALGIPHPLLKRLNLFSKEQLIELGKLISENTSHMIKLLSNINPSLREEIFNGIYEEKSRETRIFSETLLYELPGKLRHKEATRILALPKINEDKYRVINYVSCLYINDSREKLVQSSYASNADDRALALMELIQSTSLSRKGVSETLNYLARIKNDQDPVKSAVFNKLSNCPPSIFKENNIQELTLLINSALEARDTSYCTVNSIQSLAFSIMVHNSHNPKGKLFKFSTEIIAKIAKRNGYLNLPSLEKNLPKGTESLLFDELYQLLLDSNKRENFSLTLSLAKALGRRGYGIPKLQELLKEASTSINSTVALQAVSYWLGNKETRDERVKELLSIDKSYIVVNEVFLHLHYRRQELLDQFISGKVISGRFLTGKTIYLLQAQDEFYRWLPYQQEALGLLLERIASDTTRNTYERIKAIKTLSVMPDYTSKKLVKFLTYEDVPILEATLHGLSLNEYPEKSLSILLENLDGDKSRVAMYSIPRCLRRVSPTTFSTMIKELLQRDNLKITVKKEAIRLLGTFKSDTTLSLLLNEASKTNLHKDVAIAIGHAAKEFLDNDSAWRILYKLASSEKSDIAKSILSLSQYELPNRHRNKYLELIVAASNHKDSEVSRLAFTYMSSWKNVNEKLIAECTSKTIINFEDTTIKNEAIHTLFECSLNGTINPYIINVFGTLSNIKITDTCNATPQRDLPHRQRLFKLTEKFMYLPRNSRLKLVPLFEGIINILKDNPTFKNVITQFYIASIDWTNIEKSAFYIRSIVHHIENQPFLINNTYDAIIKNLKEDKGCWSPENLLQIIDILSHHKNDNYHYISLALLELAGPSLLWDEASSTILRKYRSHNNIAIQTKALNIWTVRD